jgi:GH24 family phage-related lysozyme (muramidase)
MVSPEFTVLRTAYIYKDQAGLPTIGYGHLINGKKEKEKYAKGLSEQEARELLKTDIKMWERYRR